MDVLNQVVAKEQYHEKQIQAVVWGHAVGSSSPLCLCIVWNADSLDNSSKCGCAQVFDRRTYPH